MRELLTEHVIVVGFGRVGQAVAAAVHELGHSCLVLDRDPGLHDPIQTAGHVPMTGDATDEEALEEAGIHRAAALIAAAEHDNVNLIITLTARAVRPGLRIISRVNEAAWRDRIVRAGADIAQSPYPSYGMSLATCALTPGVLDVHGLPTLGLGTEEIEVSKGSPFVGRSLVEIDTAHSGVFIAGLRRDAQLRRWDDVDGPIVPGDVVVALGTPEFLRELAQHSQGNWTT